MTNYSWAERHQQLYQKSVLQYEAGGRDAASFFSTEEVEFLRSIGATAMELYDYAEDASELSCDTALLITSARRDYFLSVLGGQHSATMVREFPARDAELSGIAWLPRLIVKAQARLRGELAPELMYCCGGDRKFFKEYDIHPADFLRVVWAADGDHAKILDYVNSRRQAKTSAA